MYELAANRHPFVADSQKALAQRVMSGKYPPISSTYSQELADMIARMLGGVGVLDVLTNLQLSMPAVVRL